MVLKKKSTRKLNSKKSTKIVKHKKITKAIKKSSIKKSKSSKIKKKYHTKEPCLIKNINDPTNLKHFYEKEMPHHHEKIRNKFFKDLFDLNGYYRFVWFPIVLLVFALCFELIFKAVIYTLIPSNLIYFAKHSIIYFLLASILVFINFFAYFVLAYSGVKHNYRFNRVFKIVSKITIFFVILEFVFILTYYFTFMINYLSLFNLMGSFEYLFYLFIWVIIKYIVLLFLFTVIFIAYRSVKHRL